MNSFPLRVGLVAIAIVLLAGAYLWASVEAMNLAFQWERPSWWTNLFTSRSSAAVAWLQIPHTLAILGSALPIGLCVALLARRHAVLVGSLVGLIATGYVAIPLLLAMLDGDLPMSRPWLQVLDHVKLLLAVPSFAALFAKLLSGETDGYWFPAKRFGWGWGFPSRWQGWFVFTTIIGLIVAYGFALLPQSPEAFVIVSTALLGLLVAVCYVKGEPARWRWGNR